MVVCVPEGRTNWAFRSDSSIVPTGRKKHICFLRPGDESPGYCHNDPTGRKRTDLCRTTRATPWGPSIHIGERPERTRQGLFGPFRAIVASDTPSSGQHPEPPIRPRLAHRTQSAESKIRRQAKRICLGGNLARTRQFHHNDRRHSVEITGPVERGVAWKTR